MVLLLNLSDEPLVAPALGVGDEGHLVALKQGGYTRAPLFGGGGQTILTELAAYGVYALLVPEGATDFNVVADECEFTYQESLAHGEAMYAIPEPATLMLLALGGTGLLMRRRRCR